jgi:glycosyltransferase involved in cell wall biosynthesis
MSALPSFSIVVPTYQRRDTVCDAVACLSRLQYDGPVEIIVVVDGSNDGTAEALAELHPPFSFRVISQPNAGLARARNRGAAEATGEILLFIDDDMMAAPDILTQHALSYSKGMDAVIGHIPLDPASPDTFLAHGVGKWAESRRARLVACEELDLFDLLGGHLSVKRALFEELGGFDTAFTKDGAFGDEDIDFGVRLLERARVVFNPDAISYQRYIVTPRQLLRQWGEAGEADVLFAHKHPTRAARLFELHGSSTWLTRLVLRPMAALPYVPALFGAVAAWISDRERFVPRPFRRPIVLLFAAARDVTYWSGVRNANRAHLAHWESSHG